MKPKIVYANILGRVMRCEVIPVVLDWSRVARFNFTYAIPGGAWLEWPAKDGAEPYRNWFPFLEIQRQLGQVWIDRQLRRQGCMTGCWIEVG